ncbi:MAG: hypothetical protein H6551_04395 [Chitinophagales bacterium]|nr:hypothetical protein [Chitinophagaceae bacterium]MCB9064364.1 hypothetical protein [Chitinophagales bacterium]
MNIKLLRAAFFLGMIMTIIGAVFKIQHWPYAGLMLKVSLVTMLLFFAILIYDIISMPKANGMYKLLWVLALIVPALVLYIMKPEPDLLITLIVSIIYLTWGRKRLKVA